MIERNQKDVATTREDSTKAWIQTYIEEIWNKRDFTQAGKYWAPGFVNAFAPELGQGPEAMKAQVKYFLDAFTEFQFEVKDIMVEADRVSMWIEISGTHTGELFGIPASGKTFPNPFSNQITFEYHLTHQAEVTVEVFDLLGKKVRLLYKGKRGEGTHKLSWDGRSESGATIPSGVYIYRLRAGNEIILNKTSKLE